MKFYLKSIFIVLAVMLLAGCSAMKYVPEDEKLYDGAIIKLKSETVEKGLGIITTELESVVRPVPNSKILGMRLGLRAHYKAQREKPGFLNRFFNKRIGEEPVYMSDLDVERTKELLDNRLENRGFYRNDIIAKVDEKERTGNVTYEILVRKPYRLENYIVDTDSLPIYKEIKNALASSPIKKGVRYDLAVFKRERERIDKHLKEQGYYNFNADFLIFEVDTNRYKDKRYDLFLRLKRQVPLKSMVPYNVETVNVFPEYNLETDGKKLDTTVVNGIRFIQRPEFFKPKHLEPYILFEPGKKYNPTASRLTSNRLASIGTYKFINIKYETQDSIKSPYDTGKLYSRILLSPLNKRAIRTELQAVTKSNNFSGPGLAVVYSNRNLFKGGETLNISGNIGYETQVSSGDNAGLSSTQLGLKTDLIFPRLLFPIKLVDRFEYAIPKTIVSLGAEYLNRSKLYSLTSFKGSFGYTWNANKYVYHQLNPISLNYVSLGNTTPEFEAILTDNPFLRNSFDQQFIAGLTYSFTYSELGVSSRANPLYFNANFDIAGNTIDLLSSKTNEDGNKEFLGLEYAQYAKLDVDFRYYFNLGNDQKIVSRLFAGVGLPYGNSDVLPFSKQFFAGGPYSVRAFRIRSLGPGTYRPEDGDQGSFFDQSGDIRLEANLEYRFPIVSYLKGAIFADAGNVWLINENDTLPGGKFTGDFINQLGMGVGAGLRVDIQNFVIRFDLAAPLRDPTAPEGEEFNFDISNPVLNFAIGYPF